ncbi:MAG: PKD domain-containing protein [Armatimonadota bacterium]
MNLRQYLARATVFLLLFGACGAGEARDVFLYRGDPLDAAGIEVSAWGDGSVRESQEPGVTGTRSIEFNTKGLFSGAFLTWKNPVEIAEPSAISRFDYLLLRLRFNQTTRLGIEEPGLAPNIKGDYRPLPMDYYGNYFGEDLPMVPKVRRIRVILYSADGRAVSHSVPVVHKTTDEDGWFAVALPLAGFGLTAQSNGFPLRRMAISADIEDKIWIGEIRITTDDSPIYVDSLDDQDVGTQDVIVMVGSADAGITSLLYSWDFDEKDGIQEDARGRVVQVVYRRTGTYTVTLTVRDPDGIKQPASTKAQITVN